jgi:LPS export ABC transporter protein LptC
MQMLRFGLLSLILMTLFYGCGEQKVKPDLISIDGKELPSQESWGDTIYFSNNGKLQAKLVTSHLMEFDTKKIKLLDSVRVKFYNKEGEVNSTLVSDSGKVNDVKKEFVAIGNVVLKGSQGRVLYCDSLIWNSADEKIYTDSKLKIIDGNEIIEGVGLVSDKNLENYVIRKITFITSEKNIKK